jgi:hypothetical protein
MQKALAITMLHHITYNPKLLYEVVLQKQTVINHLPDSCLHTNALQTQYLSLHLILDPVALWQQVLKTYFLI